MKTSGMRIVTLMFALATILGFAGLAEAQGYGGGRGMGGPGYMAGLTPEKQAAVQKIQADHFAATAQLRQQLFAKQSELNAQLYGGTTDDKKVQTLTKEIGDLRNKLFEAKVNLRKQLIKEGVPAMGGMAMGGMGRGGMGRGGMGCGY